MSKLALFFIFFIALSFALDRPWENKIWILKNPNIYSYGIDIWWNLPEFQKTLDSIGFLEDEKIPAYENYHICSRNFTVFYYSGLGFIESFSKISNCLDYKNNWILVVDKALDEVELSVTEEKKAKSELRGQFDRLRFLGLCNQNYSGKGSQYCNQMEMVLTDNNTAILLENSLLELEEQLENPVPILNQSHQIVSLNRKLISDYNNLSLLANISVKEAESELQRLKITTNERQNEIDDLLDTLENEKIYLVKDGSFGNSIVSVVSVENMYFDSLTEYNVLGDKRNRILIDSESKFEQGHLANSIVGLQLLDEDLNLLYGNVNDLRILAKNTTDQQREAALEEISGAGPGLSPESKELLDRAENLILKGDSSKYLGDKYTFYRAAAESARQAQNSKSFSVQEGTNQKIAELERLISLAEMDQINVESEKSSLEMIKKLSDTDIDIHTESAISSIVAKSINQYGHLEKERVAILDQIELSGDLALDLLTDLQKAENGIVENGRLMMPDSIGKLHELEEIYAYIQKELDFHISSIVANSMSTRCNPLFSSVKLDLPAEISLDLVLSNPREYQAKNVTVFIPCDISFDYSDLSTTEAVSIYYDNGIYLIFPSVKPFEVKRLSFEKNSTIAYTHERKIESEALGDGVVRVVRVVDFELDFPIPHLELDPGPDYLIDGNPPGPLARGSHQLRSTEIINEAYILETRNIQSYKQGMNSIVEYNLDIKSQVDLEELDVIIDAPSKIEKFHSYAITGGHVSSYKKISDSQYAIRLKSIENSTLTTIKISYEVENISSYLSSQIAQYEIKNLSDAAYPYFATAKALFNSGNYSDALEQFAMLDRVLSAENKENEKLNMKVQDLKSSIRSEFEELANYSSSHPFFEKLNARKEELKRVLDEIDSLDPDSSLELLKDIDPNWVKKELTSLKKESYKEFNGLKEKYYSFGNFGTPSEFGSFEEALHKLEAGFRIEYGEDLVNELLGVRSLVSKEENIYQEKISDMENKQDSIRREVENIFEQYSRLSSSAKGTDYSSIFTVSEKKVDSQLKDLGLAKEPNFFQNRYRDLNETKNRMLGIISSLENESESKLMLVESLYKESKGGESVLYQISKAKSLHDQGDFVNALRLCDQISRDIEEKTEEFPLLIFGITGLAVLGGISVLIIKKPKKELRQLRKITDL